MEGVSVIICCYNSARRLPETLKHLAFQKRTINFPVEVIVIDNNCTDNTSETAALLWQQFNTTIPIRIENENQPGLTYARKKGVALAIYDYILFCDDDNWLNENYVEIAYNIMIANPAVGILGGQTYGVYEIQPPEWFMKYNNYFAIGKQFDFSGDITKTKGWVWGAGSVYRKEIFDKIDSLAIDLLLTGRKGNKMTSGEDVELCFIAKMLGYRIWYEEQLICAHYMTKTRFSQKKFNQLCIANGYNYLLFDMYHSNHMVTPIELLRNIKFHSLKYLRTRKIQKPEVTADSISFYESIGELKGNIHSLIHYLSFKKHIHAYIQIEKNENNCRDKQLH